MLFRSELKDFYVANFLADNNHWVGDLLTPQGEEIYKKWQKTNQSLTYTFENDIIWMLEKVIQPNDMLVVERNQFPLLLQHTMSGTINLETVIILNDILKFLPMWNEKIDDDIIWPQWETKIKKYTPFLHYDKEKFKIGRAHV